MCNHTLDIIEDDGFTFNAKSNVNKAHDVYGITMDVRENSRHKNVGMCGGDTIAI
jgi:hypothetical protein